MTELKLSADQWATSWLVNVILLEEKQKWLE